MNHERKIIKRVDHEVIKLEMQERAIRAAQKSEQQENERYLRHLGTLAVPSNVELGEN